MGSKSTTAAHPWRGATGRSRPSCPLRQTQGVPHAGRRRPSRSGLSAANRRGAVEGYARSSKLILPNPMRSVQERAPTPKACGALGGYSP